MHADISREGLPPPHALLGQFANPAVRPARRTTIHELPRRESAPTAHFALRDPKRGRLPRATSTPQRELPPYTLPPAEDLFKGGAVSECTAAIPSRFFSLVASR
jgi:hypothetical protein